MADIRRLPGPNADLWEWQLDGACRGKDGSLFFHPEGERGASRAGREEAAKRVCARCPVVKPVPRARAVRARAVRGVGRHVRGRAGRGAGGHRRRPSHPLGRPTVNRRPSRTGTAAH